MGTVQKLLTLDFAGLKGWRTVLGGVGYIIDLFVEGPSCAIHPAACAILKGLSGWLLVMGIRGK